MAVHQPERGDWQWRPGRLRFGTGHRRTNWPATLRFDSRGGGLLSRGDGQRVCTDIPSSERRVPVYISLPRQGFGMGREPWLLVSRHSISWTIDKPLGASLLNALL